MEKQTIQIATPTGFIDTEAVPSSHPAVVVHRASFATPTNEALGLWAVTHVPSGYAFLCVVPNREIALILAEYFISLGLNLEGSKDEILASATPQIRAKFARIRDLVTEANTVMIELLVKIGAPVATNFEDTLGSVNG